MIAGIQTSESVIISPDQARREKHPFDQSYAHHGNQMLQEQGKSNHQSDAEVIDKLNHQLAPKSS
ncbi:MAG: hypothetical protein CMN93_07785 [Synechococcus sp. CPC35]|nr:hypothetical protein [Synechococcus sp. CPC35]